MKRKISNNKLSLKSDLRNFLNYIWSHKISKEHLKNLVDSMPRRIQAIIKTKEGPTKY